jgi:4'-phosphopantetheinyl transferase
VTDDTFREAPAIGPAPWTVDVWSAALDPPAPLLSLLRDQLSADEHGRARRFVRDRDRERFVAGRAFLRLLLGQCLGEDPRELFFRYGPNGKPELEGPPRGLAFNLAHAEALAVCAVARGCDALGVDVERVRPMADTEVSLHPFELEGEHVGAVAVAGRGWRLRLRAWPWGGYSCPALPR